MRRIPERVMCDDCGCCEVEAEYGCTGRCDYPDDPENCQRGRSHRARLDPQRGEVG